MTQEQQAREARHRAREAAAAMTKQQQQVPHKSKDSPAALEAQRALEEVREVVFDWAGSPRSPSAIIMMSPSYVFIYDVFIEVFGLAFISRNTRLFRWCDHIRSQNSGFSRHFPFFS